VITITDPEIIKQFCNNEPLSVIPGGNRRPSKQVDLKRFDAIRRRQKLNVELLKRTCGVDEKATQILEGNGFDLLQKMAQERDPNGNLVIRKQAIQTLGQFRSIEVAELLWRISSNDLEQEAIRGEALLTLARTIPGMAPDLMQRCLEDESPLIRQIAVKALAEIGDRRSLEHLIDHLKTEKDIGIKESAIRGMQVMGQRLGVRVPKLRARKIKKDRLTPKRRCRSLMSGREDVLLVGRFIPY
jgi:hypothetical protein